MENETIAILQKRLHIASELEGNVYAKTSNPKDPGAKKFYGNIGDCLEQCNKEGYQSLFMPELVFSRVLNNKDVRVEDAPIPISIPELWHDEYVTSSIRASGKTKNGAKIVIYAHVPNYLSNAENLKGIIKSRKLVSGAAPLPQTEFDRLESLNENGRVFVIDYEASKKAISGTLDVPNDMYLYLQLNMVTPLKHPEVIPFLGGQYNTVSYLAKHSKIYSNRMGVYPSDDGTDEPMGRLLRLGNRLKNDLDGSFNLERRGIILGVSLKDFQTKS